MADTVTPPTASPVSTMQSKSLGQDIDNELNVVKARLALLEADGKTAWADVVAWGKAQWPHFVTWGGTALVALKAFGVSL